MHGPAPIALPPVDRVVGERLTSARLAAGMSQRELSRATGIGQPEISRLERGCGHLTVAKLVVLALALHVDPADVIAW